ncbi:cytochrome P450 [Halobacteriales archaeon QS_1_68_20]|nr:MAG: cytochrome P450 [Halobacteriales archaeon QS_1_68_20]
MREASPRNERTADGDPAALPLPPGPDGWPVVGNAVHVVRDPFGFYDALAEYGDVVRYRLGRSRFVTVLRPDLVEQVLLEDFRTYDKWTNVDFAPEGLVFTDGQQWRRQRTVVQEAFTVDRVRSYGDAMARFADERVDDWADGERVALNEAFSNLTLRVLAHTLLDVDLASGGGLVAEFADVITERANLRSLSAFLPSWVPTPANRRFERTRSAFREYVDATITDREHEGREDLLSLFLHATGEEGGGLREEEVRDQVITFLFAGHETTSLALTYAVLLLARHPEQRQRLDEEYDDVMAGARPTVADVADLTVTERVIREALRLYPPVPVLSREAAEDAVLDGYRVPEGTRLIAPQFYLHTDERWWSDPESFRPDRWTEEREAERPDYAYFPFGGGPRHCIGMRFAMLEMQLVLATMLQRVEFELLSDPDPDLHAGGLLRPQSDVEVRVRKR